MIYADIYPYFKKISNHYWDEPFKSNISVWDWLGREYGIVHAFGGAASRQIVVSFPDEKMYTLFALRWS